MMKEGTSPGNPEPGAEEKCMTFEQLGLIAPICTSLQAMGYRTPTPIQEKAIPPALQGRDVLGCAQTGTGKTCAYAAPILQMLYRAGKENARILRALVITPTRELAIQIGDNFHAYGAKLPLRSAVIFGGVNQNSQVSALEQGLDILTATPGRLLDLHQQGLLDLSRIQYFVLDEADRMLDMGFIHDVRKILKLLPAEKQTLFFSATMPQEVMSLVNELLRNYVRVEADPVSTPVEAITQKLYYVDKSNKTKLLISLIQENQMDSVLVFTRTKHGANRIAAALEQAGIPAAAIHGNKSQSARQEALANFKSGAITALVATDIAARGLDIDALDWVVNYDLPEVAETYVHRIGRTGRAGRGGTALSFCRADEQPYLKGIEKLLGRPVPVVQDHPYPMTEPPTGVDPMTEVRREGRENRRQSQGDAARRAAARQQTAQTPPTEETPPEPARPNTKKKTTANTAPTASTLQLPEKPEAQVKPENKVQTKPAQSKSKSEPKPEEPQPEVRKKPVSSGHTSLRRSAPEPVLQAREEELEELLPAHPAQAETDFQRPDPLAGDRIMDATARLLAPKPRSAYLTRQNEHPSKSAQTKASGIREPQSQPAKSKEAEQQKPPKEGTPAAKSGSKKKKKKKKSSSSAGAAQPQTQPQKVQQQKAQPKAAPEKAAKPAPKSGKQSQSAKSSAKSGTSSRKETGDTRSKSDQHRSRKSHIPRRPELPRDRVKDSTEQPSLMKPYYMHGDEDD